MALTFTGGSALPAVGTAAYNAAAAAPAGIGSYNASTGVVSSGGKELNSPTSIWTGTGTGPTPQAPVPAPTITKESLTPQTPITLPQTPPTTNVGNIVGSNNVGLQSLLSPLGYSLDKTTGQFSYTPPTTNDMGESDRAKNLLLEMGLVPRKSDIYSDPEIAAQNALIEQSKQTVNNLTANLNGIVAKAQADTLSLTGQGRGVPEAIIGGQQAQINKEAAIKALPVQAQIAAAQGNLQLAQDHLDTLFKIKSEAATNEYNYKALQYAAIKDFVTKDEDIKLKKLETDNNRAYNEKITNIQKQDEWSKLAVTNGSPALISSIQALNPSSPTFSADLGRIANQIAPKLDTQVVDVGGRKILIDSKTGIKVRDLGATTSTLGGAAISPALANAINQGTIDPNKINSRTLGIYESIAQKGVDAVGSHAGAAGETKAVTDLSTYKSTATRTLAVLESNLPLVENLADKVNTTGIPGLDSYISGVKAYTGNNTDVIKYINSLKTLRAEYAQMLAKGNATTESDKAEAAQAIPAGLSSAGYKALGDQLKLEAANILQASDDAIKAAKSKGASNSGPANQTSGSTVLTGPDGKQYNVPNNQTVLTGPDGKQYNVPNNQVDAFIKAGGKR